MEMQDSAKICLKEKFATFKGRASRAEYWLFYGAMVMASFILTMLGALLGILSPTLAMIIYVAMGIGVLVLIIPGLAVTVRRLHDVGKSGWYILFSFIPVIGYMYVFYLTTLSGESGPNKFGEQPVE